MRLDSRLNCIAALLRVESTFGQILKAMINNHSMHCLVVTPLLNASRGNTAFLLSPPGSPSVARQNQTELCWMGLNKSMVLLTLDEGMKLNPSRQLIFIHFYLSSSFQTITWYNFIRPSLRSPDQFTIKPVLAEGLDPRLLSAFSSSKPTILFHIFLDDW